MKANRFGQVAAILISILFIGALVYAIFLAGRFVIAIFGTLDSQVAIVTTIGCCMALVAAGIIARGARMSGQANRSTALREEKTAAYQLFLDFWINLSMRSAGSEPLGSELSARLQVLDRLLLLYASADVLKSHASLRALAGSPDAKRGEIVKHLGQAMQEIRRDLGSGASAGMTAELERLLVPAHDESTKQNASIALAHNA